MQVTERNGTDGQEIGGQRHDSCQAEDDESAESCGPD
jgi:hypothetical protein